MSVGESEGEGTNFISIFYLENQGFPLITTPEVILFSGILQDFEAPVVGTELEILGSMYKVTRIIPPININISNVIKYFVEPLEKDRVKIRKELPHDQWMFTDV